MSLTEMAVDELEGIPAAGIGNEAARLIECFAPRLILIGAGTGSRGTLSLLQALGLSIPLQTVEERHTSEAARKRYLAEHPARGLHRLLPPGMRTPSEPYDDYVAIILAERWWASQV